MLVGIAERIPANAESGTGEKERSKIDKNIILEIASQVAFAAAVDESRPVLTGCRFSVVGDRLVVVATDGFRLSRKSSMLNPQCSKII